MHDIFNAFKITPLASITDNILSEKGTPLSNNLYDFWNIQLMCCIFSNQRGKC